VGETCAGGDKALKLGGASIYTKHRQRGGRKKTDRTSQKGKKNKIKTQKQQKEKRREKKGREFAGAKILPPVTQNEWEGVEKRAVPHIQAEQKRNQPVTQDCEDDQRGGAGHFLKKRGCDYKPKPSTRRWGGGKCSKGVMDG